jgi:hypothetical protein
MRGIQKMREGKHGLKVLGLCSLAVLGLMALTAATAQAKGEFAILGAAIKSTETIKGAAEGKPAFLVPSLGLEIVCEGATVEGTIETAGHGEQTLKFSNCTAPPTPTCIVEPIVAKFLTLVLEHAGEKWLLFTPPTGSKAFTIIKFKSGTGCPLPLTNELTGSFIALIGTESSKQLLEFKSDKATQELFGTKYSFGVQPAFLDMSVIWELSGKNAGCKWGAV